MVRLKRRLSTLRVGDPLDKNTDIGAINSSEQLAKIRALSEIGDQEGAERWSPPCDLPERGYWFPPTVFTGVTQAHRIAREEIFGPVLSVLRFHDEDEVVDKANDSPFGLSAYLHTRDSARAQRIARRLDVGTVIVNGFPGMSPGAPFGGVKQSGFGREGGRAGIDEFVRRKNVVFG
jgi:aldehyde dehydrogenase (NAD+)